MLYNKDVDEKVAERYAKVSSALFDVLAQMKASEVKVYLCICKYANFKNGICFQA